MNLVTITCDESKNLIIISFAEDIEAYLVFFPDTRYLIDNCLKQEGNMIQLTEEQFQEYVDCKHTIPLLVTNLLEDNISRIEYAFNYVLSILKKELEETRKRIEKDHIPHTVVDIERIQSHTDKLILQAYRYELTKKVAHDLREHKLKYPEGFFYEDNVSGGM